MYAPCGSLSGLHTTVARHCGREEGGKSSGRVVGAMLPLMKEKDVCEFGFGKLHGSVSVMGCSGMMQLAATQPCFASIREGEDFSFEVAISLCLKFSRF